MDLIQREEAQKNPNRGMGGLRSPQANFGVDRDDKDVTNPFKRYRPDDTRKKWANKELDFDDLCVQDLCVRVCMFSCAVFSCACMCFLYTGTGICACSVCVHLCVAYVYVAALFCCKCAVFPLRCCCPSFAV